MIKKITTYLLSFLLLFIFVFDTVKTAISFASTGSTSSSEYYSCILQDLHDNSVYTTLSDVAPQITVFTYGCGGELSNWCNDGKSDTFDYDKDSMVTALQKRLGNCKLFKVSFNAGQNIEVDTKSKKD